MIKMMGKKDMRQYDFSKELLELNLVEALAKNTEYRNALLNIQKTLSDFKNSETTLSDLINLLESELEKSL